MSAIKNYYHDEICEQNDDYWYAELDQDEEYIKEMEECSDEEEVE